MSVNEMKFKKGNNKKHKLAPGVITGSGSNFDLRRIIFAGLFLIILLSLGYLGYKYLRPTSQSEKYRVCSEDLVARASDSIAPGDNDRIKEFGKITEEIKQQPEYQNDINCVYPIVLHASFVGNGEEARTNYVHLLRVTDENQELSAIYQYRLTNEEIGDYIKVFEEREKLEQENAVLFQQ